MATIQEQPFQSFNHFTINIIHKPSLKVSIQFQCLFDSQKYENKTCDLLEYLDAQNSKGDIVSEYATWSHEIIVDPGRKKNEIINYEILYATQVPTYYSHVYIQLHVYFHKLQFNYKIYFEAEPKNNIQSH